MDDCFAVLQCGIADDSRRGFCARRSWRRFSWRRRILAEPVDESAGASTIGIPSIRFATINAEPTDCFSTVYAEPAQCFSAGRW
jgi:hypothetical protein